jgi:hypothetical protein
VQNLFDKHYSTLGILGDPTGVNAPGVDNRFQSPGMPRAWFGGVRFTF